MHPELMVIGDSLSQGFPPLSGGPAILPAVLASSNRRFSRMEIHCARFSSSDPIRLGIRDPSIGRLASDFSKRYSISGSTWPLLRKSSRLVGEQARIKANLL